MDIEYHYWITGIIAQEAGFTEEEAGIIAYASQFVDENDVSLTVRDRESGEEYVNFVSQTLNILKPRDELLRIYPIFHFVPGQPDAPSARRRDGKMHLFNTTPNSQFANSLLQAALHTAEDLRLYRIGIATHTYADTWAHQNFTGWHESFNAIGLNPIPNIGHADAQHHPDWVGHRWVDTRLVDGQINNSYRFLSASQQLFGQYCAHLVSVGRYSEDRKPKWQGLETTLLKAMGPAASGDISYGQKERVKAYRELAPWLPEFDEEDWLKDAIEVEVVGMEDSKDGILSGLTVFKDKYWWRRDKDIQTTSWYKFQRSVKQHEKFALDLLSPHFAQIGVDLRQA